MYMKKVWLSLLILSLLFLSLQGLAFAENNSLTKLGCLEKVISANGNTYIKIDYVEMLNIEQAKLRKKVLEAAEEDGDLEKDDSGELYFLNDYYIYNPDKKLHTLMMAKGVKIFLCDFQSQNVASTFKSVSPAYLKKFISSEGSLLCYISVKNSKVTKIAQQYTP